MKEFIGLLAAVIAFAAYAPYFRDIFKAKTKPHAYSWFVWGFTDALIFALQLSQGAGPGAFVTLFVTVLCFAIFFLSLKNGRKNIRAADTVCLVAALLASGLWLFAKQPLTSMILLNAADVFGLIPTIRKSWNKPHEETISLWSLSAVRHLLTIGAIKNYNAVTLLNPVMWAIGNGLFALMLLSRRQILSSQT